MQEALVRIIFQLLQQTFCDQLRIQVAEVLKAGANLHKNLPHARTCSSPIQPKKET